jgi:hypothetical protein
LRNISLLALLALSLERIYCKHWGITSEGAIYQCRSVVDQPGMRAQLLGNALRCFEDRMEAVIRRQLFSAKPQNVRMDAA